MQTLSRELRRSLENTVREARRIAEGGARKVIEQLAVHHHEPWSSMTPEQRVLRNALRAHGRQLGDHRDERRGVQAIDWLTTECAYEHWHRMLFARFLAETNLLIEPKSGMDITLADCQELARERGEDWLELASSFAERMLPEIFRTGDPVLKVALPPETRSDLENLLKALPRDVFVAGDSLGWVYQYWQGDRKDEVNRSEKKIGADELPAVTQLFTEDYMVLFLLHNTLGAWWAGKVLAAKPELASSAKTEDELRAACAVGGIEWTYLRFVRDGDGPWRPVAGTFDGWPKVAKAITLLDPCMGSGHFLVFALPILVAFRMTEEGISQANAVDAVLCDNLFGLEIDPRCTQIAAFNLALAAWRRVGYRALPALHLACSGLSLGVTKAEWLKLAERAAAVSPMPPKTDLLGSEDNLFSDAMKRGFERLYELFARAPWLGSLIDPRGGRGDLIEHGFADLEPLLAKVLARADSAELSEMAVTAQGVAKAAEILAGQFTLVGTNVPYLGRNKQDDTLREYCEAHYPNAKADLATCMLARCSSFCCAGGVAAIVSPQSWWFLGSFTAFRKGLLNSYTLNCIATLGEEAWQSFGDRGPVATLMVLTSSPPAETNAVGAIDALPMRTIEAKINGLQQGHVRTLSQVAQKANPDHRITVDEQGRGPLLSQYASSLNGTHGGDFARFRLLFWEIQSVGDEWRFFQGTVERTHLYGGRESIFYWPNDGEMHRQNERARVQGDEAWGKVGVAVSLMRSLNSTLYTGELFDMACSPIVPYDSSILPALWAFCESGAHAEAVRGIEQRVMVTCGTLVKVPFDVDYWRKVAREKYPLGLPRPHSAVPTQWLFNGHPKGSYAPLQVAVARLVGYRWPRQTGSSFPDCPALGHDGLEKHADRDGIVTLSPVKGEPPAADRVIALLGDAFGGEWSAAKLAGLLTEAGFAGKTLDDWLRDGFFAQHCELFHQRPFVWHVWDGRRDGFHALVNYHRLAAPNGEGRRTLEKLLYTYLGDWIDRQRADQKTSVEGADARLAAAHHLKTELTSILAGEPPYDLFVRWKPLADQAIGWEPDVNDGMRMNIRPFMTARPLGAKAKGACILRVTPKIKWEKDRGKEPQRVKEDFPWFWGWDEKTIDFAGRGIKPDGNRWNDLHYSRSFKEAARARSKK